MGPTKNPQENSDWTLETSDGPGKSKPGGREMEMKQSMESAVESPPRTVTKEYAVVRREPVAVAPAAPADNSPASLVRLAIERDLPIEKLQAMLDLQRQFEADAARKAYVAAMSEFKRDDCPILVKDRKVSYRNNKGQLVEYEHTSLAQVVGQSVSAMAKHGFHHDWSVEQAGNAIAVTCTLTHRDGHREKTRLSAASDTSGSKNAIQAVASTVTYLERYTLLMALGLAPADDDDGRAFSQGPAGREAPPVDLDAAPNARARKAIAVWGKYLGAGQARFAMEQLTKKPAGQWGDDEYAALMDAWAVVRGQDTPEAKARALVASLAERGVDTDSLGPC